MALCIETAPSRHGFTLVELSIVLVILGLLTGGILTGQSLIRAAELRSTITEFQRYQAAIQSFRDRYLSLPGDMRSATRFWGDDNAACADAAVTNGTPGTCNGDGDGVIEYGAATVTSEVFQFWKQMALAGLIEGSYSGLAGAASGSNHDTGVNAPASKISNAVWGAAHLDNSGAGATSTFARNYLGYMTLGGDDNTYADGPTILRPEEAWNIDMKMDDGRPAYGKVQAGIIACSDAADNIDYDSDYLLANTGQICAIFFNRE